MVVFFIELFENLVLVIQVDRVGIIKVFDRLTYAVRSKFLLRRLNQLGRFRIFVGASVLRLLGSLRCFRPFNHGLSSRLLLSAASRCCRDMAAVKFSAHACENLSGSIVQFDRRTFVFRAVRFHRDPFNSVLETNRNAAEDFDSHNANP